MGIYTIHVWGGSSRLGTREHVFMSSLDACSGATLNDCNTHG